MTQATPNQYHRIGGGRIENLRLKPAEERLVPPGISVLRFDTPGRAAAAIRAAFSKSTRIRIAAATVGSASEESIRAAGFDIMADSSRKLPTHCRIVHADGINGFNDVNLARLAAAFVTTTGH